ncbi:MAG TPA: metallophosphoesterase family protein [Longimicrobiales bacterium]|nr:metallophosphoesterase family protein [Longimicrobiales bacterium]
MISDTHGSLRPEAEDALRGSDLILHAGDVGDPAILEALERIAPVFAVHGNTDWGALRAGLPRSVVVDLGAPDGRIAEGPGAPAPRGPLAYVHHGDRELELDPEAAGIAVVVSGHTHKPLTERWGPVLYLNPGSAGPRRFTLPVTVAKVTVADDGTLSGEIVEIVR